jgi:hypothetical protein
MPVAKPNGGSPVPCAAPTAAALQMPTPVLPRSITQRLNPLPALPAPGTSERLSRVDSNGTPVEVTLILADILPQIPPSVLAQNVPVDLTRAFTFSMAQLSAEMARGRPTIPLAEVARQYPELFNDPQSIGDSEIVRLPMQKLLEQIGKLRRIDLANTHRVVPPVSAPFVEPPQQNHVPSAPAPLPHEVERQPLSSWLQEPDQPRTNGHAQAPHPAVEKLAQSVLRPFEVPVSDRIETFNAEIIEIVPANEKAVTPEPGEPAEPALIIVPDSIPVAPTNELSAKELPAKALPTDKSTAEEPPVDEYEVPTFGEAPVVEMSQSDTAGLDIPPFEESLAELWLKATAKVEPSAENFAASVFEQPVASKAPILEAVWVRPLRLVTPEPPEPPVSAPIEPPIAPVPVVPEAPLRTVPRLALIDTEPTAKVSEVSDPAAAASRAPIEPAPPVVNDPIPPRAVECKTQAQLRQPAEVRPPAPAAFAPPRFAPNPVLPKFPLRPPRSFSKSPSTSESTSRPKPTPPRSPLFTGFESESKAASAPSKPSRAKIPTLFGGNPLDRYFSTKAPPPVNWYAAGALLGVTGEVTAFRIGDAIAALPGITASLIVAPPHLTVSGTWPESLAVDNSLAFARRLSGGLKRRDGPAVICRQIPCDSGLLLIFAIDDLVLCTATRASEVAPEIRQKLLVVTKAMAHARQAIRERAET